VHVSVHFRNNAGRPAAAVRDAGHVDRGLGHDGGVHTGYALPVADHIRRHVGAERSELLHAVLGAGTTDVAQGQGPERRGGRGGRVAGPGRPADGCRHCRRAGGAAAGRRGRRRQPLRQDDTRGRVAAAVLVAVPAAQRLEADSRHAHVLRLPAGQRRVRATVLLDGRGPGLPGAVGQQHHITVPIYCPAHGRSGLRGDAPRRTPEAGHDFRRVHGRVAAGGRHLHEGVRGRPGPTDVDDPHVRLHNVHVLCPAGHCSHALDTVRRGFPDGGKRWVTIPINDIGILLLSLTPKTAHFGSSRIMVPVWPNWFPFEEGCLSR